MGMGRETGTWNMTISICTYNGLIW